MLTGNHSRIGQLEPGRGKREFFTFSNSLYFVLKLLLLPDGFFFFCFFFLFFFFFTFFS